MGPVPGREALEAMKRTDIQKLCKDYGVKANLKTEALIELLLDASRPQPPRSDPIQLPQRSTSRLSSRSAVRHGSVIIHGISDDTQKEDASSRSAQEDRAKPTPLPSAQLPRRKAKDTQCRLGVGRPVVAGGKGARAITKSVNPSQRSRRSKTSTTLQPSEATIVEEPEPEEQIGNTHSEKHTPRAPPASVGEPRQQDQPPLESHMSGELVESAVAKALAPVQKEVDSQKTQLAELKDKVSNMIVSFEARIRDLTLEIEGLRAQAKNTTVETRDVSMNDARSSPVRSLQPPSTPKRVWSPHRSYLPLIEKGTSSDLSSDSSGPGTLVRSGVQTSINAQHPHAGTLLPGFAHSILGKRVRDPTSNEDIEMLESDRVTETELEARIWRSATKRAKLLAQDKESPSTPHPQMQFDADGGDEREKDIDPILPIEHLPEFYAGPTSPPVMSAPATSSANLMSQNPFSFTFPVASTPAATDYPIAMGTFPFPEPPTSPSPANTAERSHSDTLVPRSHSGGNRVISGGAQPHGEATGSVIQRAPSSNEVASRMGLTAIKTSVTDTGTPALPAKRTMYGTEAERDTRFGDFGVDGVASGFWVRGR